MEEVKVTVYGPWSTWVTRIVKWVLNGKTHDEVVRRADTLTDKRDRDSLHEYLCFARDCYYKLGYNDWSGHAISIAKRR